MANIRNKWLVVVKVKTVYIANIRNKWLVVVKVKTVYIIHGEYS